MNYPIIRMNNESIILMPGSHFSKNELKSRLHEMDIDASNVQEKGILVNLYESTLSDNQNKFKIFNRLRKDTELYNSKLGISQRQSLQASNANTMSNNSKNKIINISYDVKPFDSNNTIQQDINMTKSINTNTSKGGNSYNSYNYNNQEYRVNNTGKFGYSDNQMENSRNFQSNNQSIINNTNKYNNNSSNNNNYSYYNNVSQISFDNNNDNLMNNTSSSMNNRNNINNNSYKQNSQKEINTSINRNYNYTGDSSGNNNKIFTNITTPNPQNYQKNNNQSIFNSMINNQSTKNNNFENDKNYNNYNNNNVSFNSNNPFNQNNNNYSRRVIIEEQNQSALLSNGETMPNNNRELDEESNYSIFSTFKDFKNSHLYKNRKQICFNILLSFIILSLVIVGFYLLSSFWDILTDPKSIIEGIFGFISSLFFGSIRYFYITIPIIILIVIMIVLFKRYMFKKQCEEIFKKILDNLTTSRNIIYEDDIFKRYVQNYGIKYDEFVKEFLPLLRRMRRKDSRLKSHSERVNGKDVTYWELNN